MATKTLATAAAAVALFASTTICAQAQAAAPGKFTLIGVGTRSCGAWTDDRRNPLSPQSFAEGQWVLGFLSGIGYQGMNEGADPLNGVDAEAVWAWIDNYCRANPLVSISKAAQAFDRARPN